MLLNSESGAQSDETGDAEMSGTNDAPLQPTTVNIQDINMEESEAMGLVDGTSIELATPTVAETQDASAFNITHRDGSIAAAAAAAAAATTTNPTGQAAINMGIPINMNLNMGMNTGMNLGLSPNRPGLVAGQQNGGIPTASVPRYLLERQLTPHPQVTAMMPREEDVLMSLQLLAYVSKYCNLRSYFQKSHLVPRLKIGKQLQLLDSESLGLSSASGNTASVSSGNSLGGSATSDSASVSTVGSSGSGSTSASSVSKSFAMSHSHQQSDDDSDDDFEVGDDEYLKKAEAEWAAATAEMDEEYLLPNELNIFPLVEKFTVRHHSTDMQYWAGVVMRNLCRKDESRGGIRQCAYYQCGKWEEFTRQFAKCRRCRRTKYCSKDCQKSAWTFHRHWCVAASP